MSLRILQIDAFASIPFEGNPAAVCLLPEYPGDDWLQAVAVEMNLSETAFLKQREDGFDLRWFTPEAEVELCGHATLASAHILWGTRVGKTELTAYQESARGGHVRVTVTGERVLIAGQAVTTLQGELVHVPV